MTTAPRLHLFTLAFLGACASAHSATPLQLHPDNPHYFLFRGEPTIVITSGEHYGAVLNLDFDYAAYLDALAADKMNGTRTWAGAYAEVPGNFGIAHNTLAPAPGRFICPWARSETPGYGGGGNKFDLTRWDAAYFRRLHDFMDRASQRGVIVELNLFCPMYNETMWNVCPMNAANNVNGLGQIGRHDVLTLDRSGGLLAVQDAMVRKLVAELRDYDNLYYEICNEPYATGVPDNWQRHVAEVIVEAQKPHPRPKLIAQNIANHSAKVEHPHPAVSIFNFHYAAPPDTVALNYGLNRVIGDNETGFRGTNDAPYRTEAWDFILAGGGLFNHLDYSFTVQHPRGTWATYPATQPGGGNPTLRGQFRILRDFIYGFDFVRMKPDNSVIRGGISAGGTARALVEPGRAYAVYVRRSTSTGPYSVRWTGFVEPAKSGEHAFHTFSNDGVRLWVNDERLIDNWTDHGETENTGRIVLEGGKRHTLRLEYFYNGGQGAMKLWWTPPGGRKESVPSNALWLPDSSGHGLHGDYFRGRDLRESWAKRIDPQVNFAFGTDSPFRSGTAAAQVDLQLELPAGTYQAEWVDTLEGAVAKAEHFTHEGGLRRLVAPPFGEDIALRVKRTR